MGRANVRAPVIRGSYRGALVLSGGFLVCGLAFASTSLLLPGIALALLVAGASAWVGASAQTARVERLPGPSRVVEGEPYPLRLRVSKGRLPLPVAEVHDDLLARPVAVHWRAPSLISVAVGFERRGRRVLAPPRLRMRDPLGLRILDSTGAAGGELLVLPRVEEVRRPSSAGREGGLLDGLDHGEAGAGMETAAVDLELDGLRPYRPGSPASRIHWRTVARTGQMHERRFVAGADAAPLIVLDASRPLSETSLDRAVRAAASLCLHLAVRGGCAILLPDRAMPTVIDPRLRAWSDVHSRLALVEEQDASPQPRRAGGRTAAFWVSGASATTAARSCARTMPGAYVVTPDPATEAPASFAVAGCTGQPAARVARGGAATRSAA